MVDDFEQLDSLIGPVEDVGLRMQSLEGLPGFVLTWWLGPDPLGEVSAPPGETPLVPDDPLGIDLKFAVKVADEFETRVRWRLGTCSHAPSQPPGDRTDKTGACLKASQVWPGSFVWSPHTLGQRDPEGLWSILTSYGDRHAELSSVARPGLRKAYSGA